MKGLGADWTRMCAGRPERKKTASDGATSEAAGREAKC